MIGTSARPVRVPSPVYRNALLDSWVLSRYHDVDQGFRLEAFASADNLNHFFIGVDAETRSELVPLERVVGSSTILQDGAEHTRRRSALMRGFKARDVDALAPQIQTAVDELLTVMEQSTGEADLVRDFAEPLPRYVLCLLMGFPREDVSKVSHWCSDLLSFLGGPNPSRELALRAQMSQLEQADYLQSQIDGRRRCPRDDLVSRLANANTGHSVLTDREIIGDLTQLAIAGNSTTTNLIANGLWLLLTHPDQRDELVSRPELAAAATEEVLRYESPSQFMIRTAAEPVTLGGQVIQRGESVFLSIGAANRDPDVFSDPHRFDIARRLVRNLAFGAGPHFCSGARLARLEGAIALPALLQRFPQLRLRQRVPQWQPSIMMRAMTTLPVDLGST